MILNVKRNNEKMQRLIWVLKYLITKKREYYYSKELVKLNKEV